MACITPEITPLMVNYLQISVTKKVNKKVVVEVEIKVTTEDIKVEDNLDAIPQVTGILEITTMGVNVSNHPMSLFIIQCSL